MESFFEAGASISEDLRKAIIKKEWEVVIRDEKTPLEVKHANYFINKLNDKGISLKSLLVLKGNMTEDEKNLVIISSLNVSWVVLNRPLKINGWSPKGKFKWIVIRINKTPVPKNDFESFYAWIDCAEKLALVLHEDTSYIKDICEYLSGSKCKKFEIIYREKYFNDIKELEEFNRTVLRSISNFL